MKNDIVERHMHDNRVKNEIVCNWDTCAETYDSYVSHGVQTDVEKKFWVDAFLKVIPQEMKDLTVLDAGCGTGAIGLIFAEMGCSVTGIDLSEKMMETGRKKARKRGLTMNFISGDAEYPPFLSNEFDIVISRHLLWTLPHPIEALRSWKRILKSGGKSLVIAGVWDDGTLKTHILKSMSATLGKIFDPAHVEKLAYSSELQQQLPHIGGISEENARSLFEQAGFQNITIDDLLHIRENQKKRSLWYQKMNPQGTYYLISGTKRE